MATVQRSLIKAVTWRILATTDTILIVLILTGDIKMSIGIGSIEVLTKFILYYLHERVWNKVKWNKK